MSFNGNESSVISLSDATQWTANYRAVNSGVKAHFFGINKLMLILDQTDCVGIRAYYAIDGDGAKQLVLVGVKADGEDQYTETILDRSEPCPNQCPVYSPLC